MRITQVSFEVENVSSFKALDSMAQTALRQMGMQRSQDNGGVFMHPIKNASDTFLITISHPEEIPSDE